MVSTKSTPVPFEIQAGIARDLTPKQAGNRLIDGNFIRAVSGRVTSIGGFAAQTLVGNTILGVPRAHRWWKTLSGIEYGIVGTHKGLYVITGGDQAVDITPIRKTSALTNPITTVAGQSIVTITDAVHGANPGDYIYFPTSVSYDGITFLGLYEVLTTPTANTLTFESGTLASAGGTGGGSFNLQYYLATGYADDSTTPGGYGTGAYGESTWGTPRTTGAPVAASVWCLQNFGEDILALRTRGGSLYVWDASAGTGTRASLVSTAPDKNDFMLVTSALRQCVLFGTRDTGGTYDPLLIRGSNSEDYTDFDPTTPGSNAWEYRLTIGNYIVGALETTTNEILVWTDLAVYRLRLTGDDAVYSLEHLTDGAGMVGPLAMCEVEGTVYWVSYSGLRSYNGAVRAVETSMDKFYFDTQNSTNAMNLRQKTKIFIGVNSTFSEFWIWMPTGTEREINRYMIADYKENLYHDGVMSRTCWADKGTRFTPTAFNASGVMYAHETGTTADGQPLAPWWQTGYSAIQEGDSVILTDCVEVDGEYNNTCQLTMYAKQHARVDAFTSITKDVFPTTDRVDIHIRGRYLSMKWECPTLNGAFSMGKFTVYVIPDGAR